MRIIYSAILASATLLAGCAGPAHDSTPVSPPPWVGKTQFEELGGSRQVYVGMGEAASESEARRRALSDAQAQYVRAVGGLVVSSERITERHETGPGGIVDIAYAAERYAGSTTSALIHSSETDYFVDSGSGLVRAYVKMSVPTEVLDKARAIETKRHEETIANLIEGRALSKQSREAVDGEVVYAVVSETASTPRADDDTFVAVERLAREKARHLAKVEATTQVHGIFINAQKASSDGWIASSFSSSSGRIQTEIIAERVWWEGSSAVAESYVLAWAKKENKE